MTTIVPTHHRGFSCSSRLGGNRDMGMQGGTSHSQSAMPRSTVCRRFNTPFQSRSNQYTDNIDISNRTPSQNYSRFSSTSNNINNSVTATSFGDCSGGSDYGGSSRAPSSCMAGLTPIPSPLPMYRHRSTVPFRGAYDNTDSHDGEGIHAGAAMTATQPSHMTQREERPAYHTTTMDSDMKPKTYVYADQTGEEGAATIKGGGSDTLMYKTASILNPMPTFKGPVSIKDYSYDKGIPTHTSVPPMANCRSCTPKRTLFATPRKNTISQTPRQTSVMRRKREEAQKHFTFYEDSFIEEYVAEMKVQEKKREEEKKALEEEERRRMRYEEMEKEKENRGHFTSSNVHTLSNEVKDLTRKLATERRSNGGGSHRHRGSSNASISPSQSDNTTLSSRGRTRRDHRSKSRHTHSKKHHHHTHDVTTLSEGDDEESLTEEAAEELYNRLDATSAAARAAHQAMSGNISSSSIRSHTHQKNGRSVSMMHLPRGSETKERHSNRRNNVRKRARSCSSSSNSDDDDARSNNSDNCSISSQSSEAATPQRHSKRRHSHPTKNTKDAPAASLSCPRCNSNAGINNDTNDNKRRRKDRCSSVTFKLDNVNASLRPALSAAALHGFQHLHNGSNANSTSNLRVIGRETSVISNTPVIVGGPKGRGRGKTTVATDCNPANKVNTDMSNDGNGLVLRRRAAPRTKKSTPVAITMGSEAPNYTDTTIAGDDDVIDVSRLRSVDRPIVLGRPNPPVRSALKETHQQQYNNLFEGDEPYRQLSLRAPTAGSSSTVEGPRPRGRRRATTAGIADSSNVLESNKNHKNDVLPFDKNDPMSVFFETAFPTPSRYDNAAIGGSLIMGTAIDSVPNRRRVHNGDFPLMLPTEITKGKGRK